MKKQRSKQKRFARGFVLAGILPAVVWYLIFAGLPIFYSLYLSFFRWSFLDPSQFVGLANYSEILTQDQLFYKALGNTFTFTFSEISVGTVLAFCFALLINRLKRSAPFFRTVFFLPVVSSMTAVAILWRWLFQPKFGLINQLLGLVGLGPGMWLNSPETAMESVVIMSVWKGLGFTIVLFLAGLQGIPDSLYEAAEIDGANRWQKVIRITIPLLRPTFAFILITGLINGLQAFTQMYVLTKGGPVNATLTIVYHLYNRAFEFFNMGSASAMAFILFFMIIFLTIIQLKLLNKEISY
ncbi:MAG TPA: sugar ABC transporter permease [Capillibacterium sp.]